jgi:hypothetical protein
MLNKFKSDSIINQSVLRNSLEMDACKAASYFTYISIEKLFNPNVLSGIFSLIPDSYNFSGDLHGPNAEHDTLRKIGSGKGYWQ